MVSRKANEISSNLLNENLLLKGYFEENIDLLRWETLETFYYSFHHINFLKLSDTYK